MQQSSTLRIRPTYIATAVVIMSMIAFCYSVNHSGKGVLLKQDLQGKDLYIHNETCTEIENIRTVKSEELHQEIISICTNAEKYRVSYVDDDDSDYMLGIPDDPVLCLVGENIRYEITLVSVEKELLGFGMDEPLISVSLWKKDRYDEASMNGRYYVNKWFIYCFLPQEDYERLRELVLNYGDGEEITWSDLK